MTADDQVRASIPSGRGPMPAGWVEAIAPQAIATRVDQLALELADLYRDRRPVMIGVLTGSFPFLADLVRVMQIPLEVDFLALNRFGGGGKAEVRMVPATSLVRRAVVVVEDIVDTGLTLSFLREYLLAAGASSVDTVTLLDRPARRIVDVPLEFRGFAVGNDFLVGYGLDFQGMFRNLDGLWAVDPAALGPMFQPSDRMAR